MPILDTNIFIYIADETLPSSIVATSVVTYASITKIEAVGYWNISAGQKDILEQIFAECYQYNLSDAIIDLAIKLRLRKSMSLADAIIAATAIENNQELWTANVKDFQHIDDLKIVNPTAT